jgi:hypothetical protein
LTLGGVIVRNIDEEGLTMHATNAYLNGTGSSTTRHGADGLALLDTLRSSAMSAVVEKGPSPDERQAEEEKSADTISKPGGFKNDPDDASNPNEVRYRSIKEVDGQKNT